jgi:hypothetical protein
MIVAWKLRWMQVVIFKQANTWRPTPTSNYAYKFCYLHVPFLVVACANF